MMDRPYHLSLSWILTDLSAIYLFSHHRQGNWPVFIHAANKPIGFEVSDDENQRGAEPDVRTQIRTRVVQVQIEDARISCVVPIASTDRKTLTKSGQLPVYHLFIDRFEPSSQHFSNLVQFLGPYFILLERQKTETVPEPYQIS